MSGTSNAEPDGVVSKVKVKKQIKTIVHDLETILVDLRDVAKELQEVVHEIDSLTCDLQLEEDLTDSSKTDTLNSSSSSTTTTATTASGDQPPAVLAAPAPRCLPLAICPPLPPAPAASLPPAVLTVLKKAHPPLPPPRMTSVRPDDRGARTLPPPLPPRWALPNGTTLERNGRKDFSFLSSSSSASLSNDSGVPDTGLVPTLPRPMPLLRHKNSRCPQAPPVAPRGERVRFSEKVQYHGYCPDCDLQYDVDPTRPSDPRASHLLPAAVNPRLSPLHCCSSSSSASPPPLPLPLPLPVPVPRPHHHHPLHLENGGLPVSHSFPPATAPPPSAGSLLFLLLVFFVHSPEAPENHPA
ncbi:LOW QUALITY PROTEIN: protein Largen [Aplochiton taeniatus]